MITIPMVLAFLRKVHLLLRKTKIKWKKKNSTLTKYKRNLLSNERKPALEVFKHEVHCVFNFILFETPRWNWDDTSHVNINQG